MPFEYKTTHYWFRLNPDINDRIRKGIDWEPLPQEDPELQHHLNQMGSENWELVSVHDAIGEKSVYQDTTSRGFFGETRSSGVFEYPRPIGFYFFWKRIAK